MSGLLLQTKLFKPAPRPSLIARPQLINRLNEGLGHGAEGFAAKLTLVSAPAGFGKTTLVVTWLAQLAEAEQQRAGPETAWLSLDEGDNDPVRFVSYLIAALQTALPDLGRAALQALQSPQPPATEAVLTLVLNEAGDNGTPLLLALDDYHVIHSADVHQALAFLLEHLPPSLHLLLTTRSNPPLPLSRLRARGQLVEIRANDLRFTTFEAGQFLNQMGLSLDDEVLTALEQRTEGWVAGLQLAGISMQGRDDLPDFVAAFTGSNRLILDYLTDEVLERRPHGTRNFLLRTSILDRLCGSLCDAVTGQSNSQGILEQLERANLFLIPLDEQRHWYRYHHLFADVLRNRLQQTTNLSIEGVPSQAELHRRASVWFEQEGWIDEAIQHALAAPDVERAASLVEKYSLLMIQQSEVLRVRLWLEQLPNELVQTRPRLILARGWTLVVTGHGQTIEQWLATPPISEVMAAPNLAPDISGELALLRATHDRNQGDFHRLLDLCQQALDNLADDVRGLRALAVYTIGTVHLQQGNYGEANRAFAETVVLGETKGGPYLALAALQELSELQFQRGQLSQLVQTSQQAIQMAARWGWQAMPALGMPLIYLGQVFYERNNLAKAAQILTDGIDRLRGSIEQHVLVQGYVTQAKVQLANGDSESAMATIQQGEDWFTHLQVADLGGQSLLAVGKARVWLEQGQLASVAHWYETCWWQPETSNLGYLQRLTLARLRLAQSRLGRSEQFMPEITGMLNQLLAQKEKEEWWGQVVEILLLQALVCQTQDNYVGALANLERALRLAEPEGFVRLFVDEGEPMATLLRQARRQSLYPNYIDTLLTAFLSGESKRAGEELLREPLSERELEVLRLAAIGASNKTIAAALFIALPTVKKHMSNILVKLDAQNRVEAATRARDLGLLH